MTAEGGGGEMKGMIFGDRKVRERVRGVIVIVNDDTRGHNKAAAAENGQRQTAPKNGR